MAILRSVPNLMGKFPVHKGQGGGLSIIPMPQRRQWHRYPHRIADCHSLHAMVATNCPVPPYPDGLLPGSITSGKGNVYKTIRYRCPIAAAAVGGTGGSQGHENRQPYLPLNFCIAVEGVFPVRS